LRPQAARGKPSKLIVDQRNQMIESVPIAAAEPLQHLRYGLPLDLRSRSLRTGLRIHSYPGLYTGKQL
jgi:hypothetical protein